jgi:hypothetical protein
MRVLKSFSVARFALALLVPVSLAVVVDVAQAQYGRARQESRDRILQWQGQVDREIRIEIRRGQASVIEVGSNERTRRRVNVTGAIPNRPGTLYVQVLDGRGRVDVIQQPSARNGYTGVIRLRDPDGGADRYRIAAYWEGDRRGNGRRR